MRMRTCLWLLSPTRFVRALKATQVRLVAPALQLLGSVPAQLDPASVQTCWQTAKHLAPSDAAPSC